MTNQRVEGGKYGARILKEKSAHHVVFLVASYTTHTETQELTGTENSVIVKSVKHK